MKVKVTNNVRNIEFWASTRSIWKIHLNGNSVTSSSYGLHKPIEFHTLDEAVRYAVERGFLPKDFKVEDIQGEIEVEINA